MDHGWATLTTPSGELATVDLRAPLGDDLDRLPFVLRILAENCWRHQDAATAQASIATILETPRGRVVALDLMLGTDSHTPMVNGLGVLGWGIGGLEAELIMLGIATSLWLPEVVGVRLTGRLQAGASATDLALTVT